uniref:Uncharacterized protein n=1 Tax=Cryptomonas curvata TaxID=233186 RepID=A0A7S0LWG4_9CRYP
MAWTDLSGGVDGLPPSPRFGIVFEFFAGKFYLFGGNDGTGLINDLMVLSAPKQLSWPSNCRADGFIDLYDWDHIVLDPNSIAVLPIRINLCRGVFPCTIDISGGGIIQRTGLGSIVCLASSGCSGITLESFSFVCIDREPTMSAFKVQGTAIAINNVSFSGCSSHENGGVIQSFNLAVVNIISSEFRNLHTSGFGGAISAFGSRVLAADSIFVNCSSEAGGGAIWATSYQCFGSEELVDTSLQIDSCKFDQCSSDGFGGAVMAASDFPDLNESILIGIHSTEFLKCQAARDGGAVYVSGNLVTASILTSNFSECLSIGSGGALSANSGTHAVVLKSNIRNNSARGLGGGALHSDNALLSLVESSFSWNRAPRGGGGVVFWQGHIPPEVFSLCPSGMWSAARALEARAEDTCSLCSAGTFQTGVGMISSRDCVSCSPGTYSDMLGATSAATCISCPFGMYSSALGADAPEACAFCAAGAYVTPEGTACDLCSEGKYSSSSNVTVCSDCNPGTFSAIRGANNSMACQQCHPGSYSQALASACSLCNAGSFTTGYGAADCELCTTGTFSAGLGMSSASACKVCASGSHTVAQGVCGRFVPGGDYDNNEHLVFVVPQGGSRSVSLFFTVFDIEAGYDWVRVYSCPNASCVGATLLRSLSGNTLPPNQTSDTGIMKVEWIADSAGSASGWGATWVASHVLVGGQRCVADGEVATAVRAAPADLDQHSVEAARGLLLSPARTSNQRRGGSSTSFKQNGHKLSPLKKRNNARQNRSILKQITLRELGADFTRRVSGSDLCGIGNDAVFGPCFASEYKSLEFLKSNDETDIFPGVPFTLVALKRDAYNQTIATDSSSVVQVFQSANGSYANNPSVLLLGVTIMKMEEGQLKLSIALKPTFFVVNLERNLTQLVSEPYVYLQGDDAQTASGIMIAMHSQVLRVTVRNGDTVCPKGSILSLDQEGGMNGPGVCTACKAGTYSLNPLAGIPGSSRSAPACLNCPAGGNCIRGGNSVEFQVGGWAVFESKYFVLNSCPAGYQLINSSDGTSWGIFDHDMQECKPCKENEYLVDFMSQRQACPLGASCDGSSGTLTGLPGSHWRREGDKMRVFKCEPGFIMVRDDSSNGRQAFLDACIKCLPSKYSITGAKVVDLAPCSWQGGTDQPYVCPTIRKESVLSFDEKNKNGSWTLVPDQALELCLKCPVGADCPGGSGLIPREGFWVDLEGPALVASRRKIQSDLVTVLKCPPRSCQSGGNCTPGRTGPVCGICESGWAMSSGTCLQCPSNEGAQTLKASIGVIGGLLAVVVLYFFSIRPLFTSIAPESSKHDEVQNGDRDEDTNSGARCSYLKASIAMLAAFTLNLKTRLESKFASWGTSADILLFVQGYIKVVISFYQIVSTFSENYEIAWPSQSTQVFQIAAIFRFDLVAFPGINCLVEGIDYKSKLLIYTIFPIVVIIPLFITPVLSILLRVDKERQNLVTNQFWYSLMFFLFLVYPTVSFQTLRSFNCVVIGHHGSLLMADLREACPFDYSETSTVRQAFASTSFLFWWSLACSILYPLGVPLFFLLVMRAYKVPDIAEAKLKGAKIDALVIEYRKKAMPLEVEILIRQLKGGQILPNGKLLDQQINLLFQALADGKEELAIIDFVNFFKNPKLGLPDPDVKLITELFEAKDVSGNGLLDKCEFFEMMEQLIIVHNLFTGHESLDDMHFDQLCRLYEFHANGKIYLEAVQDSESSRKENQKNSSVRLVFKVKDGIDHEHLDVPVSKCERDKGQHIRIPGHENCEIEYVGSISTQLLQQALDSEQFSKVLAFMEPNLKQKLLDIADSRVSMGTIVIPAMAWQRWDASAQGGKLSQAQIDEDTAVQRMGFLMKNYDVRSWYFEITEMFRKLFMTSLITFVFSGTSSQVAVALAVSTVSLVHYLYSCPFLDKTIGQMQSYALIAICWTLLYGIVLEFQENTRDLGMVQKESEIGTIDALSIFIVLMNSCIVIFPCIALLSASSLIGRKKVIAAAARAGRRASMTSDINHSLSFRSRRQKETFGRNARLWNNSILPSLIDDRIESSSRSSVISRDEDHTLNRGPANQNDSGRSKRSASSSLNSSDSVISVQDDSSARSSSRADDGPDVSRPQNRSRHSTSLEGQSGYSAFRLSECSPLDGSVDSRAVSSCSKTNAEPCNHCSSDQQDLICDAPRHEFPAPVPASKSQPLALVPLAISATGMLALKPASPSVPKPAGLTDSPASELDGPTGPVAFIKAFAVLPPEQKLPEKELPAQLNDGLHLAQIPNAEASETLFQPPFHDFVIQSSAAPPSLRFESAGVGCENALRLVVFGDA